MIGGVTHLGGLPGLLGRVTLLAGVTVRHVNLTSQGGVTRPTGVAFMAKSSKAKHVCYKTFEHFRAVSWQKSPETATDTQGV